MLGLGSSLTGGFLGGGPPFSLWLSGSDDYARIDNNVSFKEKVIIVPFGLEKTVSYGGGTKNGPKEIIIASHQVELFDEELNKMIMGTLLGSL